MLELVNLLPAAGGDPLLLALRRESLSHWPGVCCDWGSPGMLFFGATGPSGGQPGNSVSAGGVLRLGEDLMDGAGWSAWYSTISSLAQGILQIYQFSVFIGKSDVLLWEFNHILHHPPECVIEMFCLYVFLRIQLFGSMTIGSLPCYYE